MIAIIGTNDQPCWLAKAQTRSHSQIQGTQPTYLSSAGGRSRLLFEDVLKACKILLLVHLVVGGQPVCMLGVAVMGDATWLVVAYGAGLSYWLP